MSFGKAEFARAMARLEPFEPCPTMACGLSGGSDSLALLLLLDSWARARGGRVEALTVDHGLRAASAAEARSLAAFCAARGIDHRILRWRGDKPASGLQAAARAARYRLLSADCARRGILHLALGHQREDQAETFLLRVGAGSGPDGLAGMAAIVETPDLRLLRPLLNVGREELRGFLRSRGLAWLDDSSNLDPAFERTRLRQVLPLLACEGLDARRLADTAVTFGRLRAYLDGAQAAFLARVAVLHPAGFAWLDAEALRQAPPLLGRRALARILLTLSGSEHAARGSRIERLYAVLQAGAAPAATLGGCRILPRGPRLLVVREAAAIRAAPLPLNRDVLWDGRFRCRRGSSRRLADRALWVAPLAARGTGKLPAEIPQSLSNTVPPAARAALPAVYDLDGIIGVPHLSYWRECGLEDTVTCVLQPRTPLTAAPFAAGGDENVK